MAARLDGARRDEARLDGTRRDGVFCSARDFSDSSRRVVAATIRRARTLPRHPRMEASFILLRQAETMTARFW